MFGLPSGAYVAEVRLPHASRVLKTKSDKSVEADVSRPDQRELNEDTPAANAQEQNAEWQRVGVQEVIDDRPGAWSSEVDEQREIGREEQKCEEEPATRIPGV